MLSLLVLTLPLLALSEPPCGPAECDLVCPPEQCVEHQDVYCVMAPCCPRWSCDRSRETTYPPTPSPFACPNDWPEIGSPCEGQGQCEYGEQECCGETYPEIVFECMGGTWQAYYVDTLCILGLAPPCPDDTTTTTPPPPQ